MKVAMATALSLAGYFLAQSIRPRQGTTTVAAAARSAPARRAGPEAVAMAPQQSSPTDGGAEDNDKTTAETTDQVKEELRQVKHLQVIPASAAYGVCIAGDPSLHMITTDTTDCKQEQKAIALEEYSRNGLARSEMLAVAKHIAQLEDTVDSLQNKHKELEAQLNDLRQQCRRLSVTDQPDCKVQTIKKNSEAKKELHAAFEILHRKQSEMEEVVERLHQAKEQDEKVRKLEDTVKVHVMDAQFLWHKVEALEEDNERLRAVAEEGRREAVQVEWRLRLLEERAEDEAAVLRRKVEDLEAEVGGSDERRLEIEGELTEVRVRLEEAEQKVTLLKEEKDKLTREKAELEGKLEAKRNGSLEMEQQLARVLQQKEGLSMQVEQLQADRCADAEELVYLRWLNACLRYELRDLDAVPARDMRKSPSPQSREKVRKLVLQYGGSAEPPNPVEEVDDLPPWSPTQVSTHEEPEPDDVDGRALRTDSKSRRSKRFLGMIKQLVTKPKDRKTKVQPADELVIGAGAPITSCGDQSGRMSSLSDTELFGESALLPWTSDGELQVDTAAQWASDMKGASSRRLAIQVAEEELRRYAAAIER